jgi:hypothetical protein
MPETGGMSVFCPVISEGKEFFIPIFAEIFVYKRFSAQIYGF